MRLWRVIVLMGLTLVVGVGLGYARWGREARQLRETLARTSELVPRPAVGDPGSWTARGIVRIVLADQSIVFLTHEMIPGLMAGSTRAFTASSPKLLEGLSPGEPVRFTLQRLSGRVVLVGIARDRTAP